MPGYTSAYYLSDTYSYSEHTEILYDVNDLYVILDKLKHIDTISLASDTENESLTAMIIYDNYNINQIM